jgi:hypothetical protein
MMMMIALDRNLNAHSFLTVLKVTVEPPYSSSASIVLPVITQLGHEFHASSAPPGRIRQRKQVNAPLVQLGDTAFPFNKMGHRVSCALRVRCPRLGLHYALNVPLGNN